MMEPLSTYLLAPERLNGQTLYELRLLISHHPYFDAARLLLLKNLFLLHDESFGKELRKAAYSLKDRRPLYRMVQEASGLAVESCDDMEEEPGVDRTIKLIDSFLATLPPSKLSLEGEQAASTDYAVRFLSEEPSGEETPALRGQELIDNFLQQGNEKITLSYLPGAEEDDQSPEEVMPPVTVREAQEEERESEIEEKKKVKEEKAEGGEVLYSEQMAHLCIQKKQYEKALEIIRYLNLVYPNKNRYFADQIRFLEKIVNHKIK